jgi:hypothetical protein
MSNKKTLTKNFFLYEVTDWPDFQSMSSSDKVLAKQLANEALTPETEKNALEIARWLQIIRDMTNAAFPQHKGKIGFRILSWLRNKKWELLRKRSGGSQHIYGHGIDLIVTGLNAKDTEEVMRWLFSALENWHGGLAIMERDGKIVFIHLDLGERRRWKY